MQKTEVKICGLTTIEDAKLASNEKADYIGIVLFYEKSKRYCSIEKAKGILSVLDPSIKKVAVTVSPTIEQVRQIEDIGFDILQVHGELSDTVLSQTALKILRAFNEDCNKDNMKELVDNEKILGFVFDGKIPGSGKTFDWTSIKQFDYKNKLLVLAGGLYPHNVKDAIMQIKPDIVDVSTGVESEGIAGKDAKKVREFIQLVKDVSSNSTN